MRKKIALLLMACVLFALAGCGKTDETSGTIELVTPKVVNVNESVADDIVDRGYMIVGCKMDVPELSTYDKKNDSWQGLEIELAYKTAAKLFDVDVDTAKENELVHFVGVTVSDREQKLEDGEIDMMLATYSITDERSERFALSDSYYTDYIGLMVRKSLEDNNSLGSGDIKSIADLDGKYVGVPLKATTRDAFLNYIDTMNTIKISPIFCEYESYDVLFKALKDGNIDVMAVDVSILNGYVDSSTAILDARFGGQHYGAAVKKENAPLIEYVNEAIAQ